MKRRKLEQSTICLPEYPARAIEAVLSYLWDSERADYQQCPPGDRHDHIFRRLQSLARWLEVDRMHRHCSCACKAKKRKGKLHGFSRSSSRPK